MSAAHTPGPWSLCTVQTSSGVCHKIGPFPWKQGKQNHACIYVDYPSVSGSFEAELLANAHLIAEAPELLNALKLIVSRWDLDAKAEIPAAVLVARAVIAKAAGAEL